jgi:hypothetical protein
VWDQQQYFPGTKKYIFFVNTLQKQTSHLQEEPCNTKIFFCCNSWRCTGVHITELRISFRLDTVGNYISGWKGYTDQLCKLQLTCLSSQTTKGRQGESKSWTVSYTPPIKKGWQNGSCHGCVGISWQRGPWNPLLHAGPLYFFFLQLTTSIKEFIKLRPKTKIQLQSWYSCKLNHTCDTLFVI